MRSGFIPLGCMAFAFCAYATSLLAVDPVQGAYLRTEPEWVKGPKCGPNSLYVLARLLGKDVSLDYVNEVCPVDPSSGASLGQLQAAAGRIGLKTEVIHISPERINELPKPFIAHISNPSRTAAKSHFLVVFSYRPETHDFGVIDGTSGLHSFRDGGTFCRSFSGYALVPSPHRPLIGVLIVSLVISATLCVASLLWKRHPQFRLWWT